MGRTLLLWVIGVPIRISLMAWLWSGLRGRESAPIRIRARADAVR